MRNHRFRLGVAAFCAVTVLPLTALAHTGGALDADGCHTDHRNGTYHCHRGAAAGYTFPDKAAMQEAVRTGTFPEKTVEVEGFFSKLWPWGKHHHEEEAAPPAGTTATGGAGAAAPASAANEKQRQIEERLKVLQGLYEMGLLSKEEYEDKRKAVLSEL
jgi:hypothetical protein